MTAIDGCTVSTGQYLAHAHVLIESFLEFHPDGRFWLLAIDYAQGDLPSDERVRVLAPADVGIDERELQRRATMYSTQGLAGSMKPDLIAAVLAQRGAPVIYLDADGRVYAELDPLAELAAQHRLVLSPHSLDPYPLHGADPTQERWLHDSPDQIVFRAGVVNAGLLAVAPGAEPFLGWWAQRTRRRCVTDEQHGLLLCQPWLTLALGFFEHRILRDRGCNVAGWNLHVRDVLWEGDRPTIDGGPLRHFHFAGSFDPERPSQLTPIAQHAEWWASLAERPGAARLAREYAQGLIGHGYRDARACPPRYEAAPDGTPIEPWMRSAYRAALMRSEQVGDPEPPNPFADGSDAFFGWLRESAVERPEGPQTNAAGSAALADRELAEALLDRTKLLDRIGELEVIRDEAIAWAERVSGELAQAQEELLRAREHAREQGEEIARLRATMQSVWSSPSWRVTRPLRGLKALVRRGRAPRAPV
jgi:hypothetical protein